MNNLATVPAGIHGLINALQRRLRVLLALRRGALLIIALALCFLTAFALDQWVGVPAWWLRALFGVMLGSFVIVGTAAIFVPCLRRVEPQALAALIERKHPEIAERLTSALTLADSRGPGHGSPTLITRVIREAEQETERIDTGTIFDPRPAQRLAGVAVLLLLLTIAPAFISGIYAEFSERLLLSWFRPANDYIVHVSPDTGAFAIGRPLTITATVQPRSKYLQRPRECVLAWRSAKTDTQRLPMTLDNDGGYSAAIVGPAQDVTFHVEIGGTVTDSVRLQAVEPVMLDGRSLLTIAPPAYANAAATSVSFVDLPHSTRSWDVVEYGVLKIEMVFNRKPVKGHLAIRETSEGGRTWNVPVQPEHSSTLVLPMLPPGTYALDLHVEAQHGIATIEEIGTLRITRDAAPQLHANAPLAGSGNEAATPSDDTLTLKFQARDDIGLGEIALETQINDQPARINTIANAEGQKELGGQHRLRLRGLVKTGDVLRYRLKSTDLRRIAKNSFTDMNGRKTPDLELMPQSVSWPADGAAAGWQVVRIEDAVESIARQNIQSDRDKISKWIETIRTQAVLEKNHLDKFRRDSFHQAITAAAQEKQLTAIRAENSSVRAELMLFAHQTGEHELLAALSTMAADIAAKEMDQAGAALARVQEKRGEADARDRQIVDADNSLNSALKRIDELALRNAKLAEYRLDQLKLDELAGNQEHLAARAAELARLDPATNPEAMKELAEIRAEQEKLAAEYARLTQQSELFRQAMQQALADQAKQLGNQAQQLAQEQAKLSEAMAAQAKQLLSRELALLAERQQALAKKVTDLGKRAEKMTTEKSIAALDPTAADNATSALLNADAELAIQEQLASENELDRFAVDLVGVDLFAWNPQQTVHKLAARQKAIRLALEKTGKDLAQLSPEQTLKRLQEVIVQQREFTADLEKLPALKKFAELTLAAKHAAEATDALQKADALAAHASMEQVEPILAGIGRSLPDANGQREFITGQIAELRALQEKIAAGIARLNESMATDEKRKAIKAELTLIQSMVIDRIGELPIITDHEPARERLLAALGALKQELQQGKLEELLKSTAQMPAALDQFRAIVLGLVQLPEERPITATTGFAKQARGLAAEQHALRKELEEMLGGSAPHATSAELAMMQEQRDRQKKLADKTGKLTEEFKSLQEMSGKSPEAMQLAQQAEEAMKKAGAGETPEAKNAAEMLGKSAEKADEMAKELARPDEDMAFDFKRDEMAKTGEALMAGKESTELAKRELERKNAPLAPKALQQATQAMNQAAMQSLRQLAQMQSKKGPAPANTAARNPAISAGMPGGALPADELASFAARPWGELPGTLRTQIVQDLRVRYGEDYARLVQQYFERIAEGK